MLAGALSPWATFRVFHNIEINLPGIVFPWGGLCLAVAVLVFLGMRRSPILCLLGALLVLYETGEAQKRVPERVKFQLAGSQMEFSASINRLLDQFHIPDIQVANLNTPNPDLLGVGLGWTADGAYLLLLGSLVGLPGDPVAVWIFTAQCPRPVPRLRRAPSAGAYRPFLPVLRRVHATQKRSALLALRDAGAARRPPLRRLRDGAALGSGISRHNRDMTQDGSQNVGKPSQGAVGGSSRSGGEGAAEEGA